MFYLLICQHVTWIYAMVPCVHFIRSLNSQSCTFLVAL